MRILVTGLNGFTGHYVQVELEKHGHEVIGLSSDIMDRVSLIQEVSEIKPHAVIHLAAIAFVGHSNHSDFYRVNLLGTHHLLEALSQNTNNLRSVMLVSSANVYGNCNENILSETSPTKPENDYAVSKLAMEQMAKLWIERLPIFIVRPFNYTGVGQNRNFVIPKIIEHVKNKSAFIELGNLNVWREFGDVRVVAEIYRKLIECCPMGKTINVCTSITHSLREVLDMAERISNHKIEVKVNPNYVRENEVRELKGDNQELKKIIDYGQTKPLMETLQWMFETNVQ